MTVAVIVLAAHLIAGAQAVQLSGVVRDAASGPLPGAAVTARRGAVEKQAITDARGRYAIGDLSAGVYSVSVRLPGFRTQTRDIELESSTIADFELPLGTLVTILWVTPLPADAYKQADAIAHVRIEATAAPAACGAVVLAAHDATVIAAFKGMLADRIALLQHGAGACYEGTKRISGYQRSYQPGEQYLIVLRQEGDAFSPLAGPSLAFPVTDGGMVRTSGFAGLPEVMKTADFVAALKNLAR